MLFFLNFIIFVYGNKISCSKDNYKLDSGDLEVFKTDENCNFTSNFEIFNVKISEGIKNITNYMFYSCINLKSVALPTTIIEISQYSFANCINLTEIKFPPSLEVIGKFAFYNSSISAAILQEKLTRIDENAFSKCKSLKKVSLPKSLDYSSLPLKTFENVFLDTLTLVTSRNILIGANISTKTLVLNGDCETVESFDVIDNAFYLPINNIIFNGSIKYILKNYMKKIKDIDYISFPNGLKKIEDYAFIYYRNNTIEFPSSINSLSEYAFPSSQYSVLQVVYFVYDIDTFVLNCTSSFVNYKIEKVVFSCSIKKIENYCFTRSAIRFIILPDSLEEISNYAFQSCRNLISICLKDTVTKIGDYAFQNCQNMKTVANTNNIVYIGNSAFENCFKLIEIMFPSSITQIPNSLFKNCFAISMISLPSSLVSIGPEAFSHCEKLIINYIPPKVEEIGNYAFYKCSSLSSLEIYGNLKYIGEKAFADCTALVFLSYQGIAEPKYGTNPFENVNDLLIVNVTSEYRSPKFLGIRVSQISMPIHMNIEHSWPFALNLVYKLANICSVGFGLWMIYQNVHRKYQYFCEYPDQSVDTASSDYNHATENIKDTFNLYKLAIDGSFELPSDFSDDRKDHPTDSSYSEPSYHKSDEILPERILTG